ncbi:MAG: long-chain fatty acid transport protein [Oleispira sp.]|jgi:long-chain fatty acid transport protein
MIKKITFHRTLAFTIASLAALHSHAGMGTVGTNYGVLPLDMASAQSLSMFNTQVSSSYYNPAYLVKDPRGELTVGIMHSKQELRASSVNRDGDVVSNTPSQHILIGMKSNLSSLTNTNHPIQLGFMTGVEQHGEEMLGFESKTSEEGQFFGYGREPLFLTIGMGTQIWRGIDIGLAIRITLEASATLNAVSDLSGETKQEAISVNAKPVLRGIVSVNFDYGNTFCPEKTCFLSGFESALAYREASATKTTIESNITVDQIVPSPGLRIAVATVDSFQPQIITLGTQYQSDDWRVGITLEHQKWSDLGNEFKGDSIKDQAGISDALKLAFNDTIIPRIGAEIKLNGNFSVTTGLSFEKSPLENTQSPDVNYFDNDKYIAGLGISALFEKTKILVYPVKFDLAYQYHMLKERDFSITPFGTETATEVVETDGNIHVLSGSMTLKF